jgi:hypothetical protein
MRRILWDEYKIFDLQGICLPADQTSSNPFNQIKDFIRYRVTVERILLTGSDTVHLEILVSFDSPCLARVDLMKTKNYGSGEYPAASASGLVLLESVMNWVPLFFSERG